MDKKKKEFNLNFEKFYTISMTALKVTGAHPSVPKDFKWFIHFLLMHGYFSGVSFIYGYNIILHIANKDLPNACSHGIFLVIFTVVTFKYVILIIFQQKLNDMIKIQQEFFDTVRSIPPEDQKLVLGYAKRGRWTSRMWLNSTTLTMFMFPVKGLVGTLYSITQGELKLYPFSETYYPYLSNYEDRFVIFVLMYILNMLFAVYCIFMYTGFAPLGPIFILNTCAKVELVQKRVNVLFDDDVTDDRERNEKIRGIIKDLQDIYLFVEDINTIFKLLYEIFLKACAIMIPVSVFLILENLYNGKVSLDYIMFVYVSFLLCFMLCFYSDLLMQKGEEFRLAIYNCGWERTFDVTARKSLLIMLNRAVRPLSIRTVFRTVCLDAFADLCHEAYAIFNLMNAAL